MLRIATVALLISPLALAGTAWGQGAGGGVGKTGFQPPVQGVGQKPVVREAPPPALPGAQQRDGAAPSEQVPLDMPPTEALFDSINRGDMAEARDSLSRGADVNGRNVLGMTPLDLSVDLGRNDITFLLLSLRGQVASASPPPAAGAVASVTAPAASRPKPVREAREARVARRPTVAGVPGQAVPVRYASVPAPAVPQAGFLGFGATTSIP